MDKKSLTFLAVLAAVSLITYASMLNNGFMVDSHAFRAEQALDKKFINLADFFTSADEKHFYPLYYLINLTLQRFFPENPFAQNAINLILFYFNCALLFFIARTLTNNLSIAALTAVLFCLHPFNADNISHTDITNTLVSAGLLQAAFLCVLGFLKNTAGNGRYLTSIVLFALALLCGEPALMFPFYLMALVFVSEKESLAQSAKICLPFFLVAAVFTLFLSFRADPASQLIKGWATLKMTPVEYLAGYAHLVFWYLRNLIYPGGIFLIYNAPPIAGNAALFNLTLLVMLVVVAADFFKRSARGAKSFALLWCLLGFLFVLPASLAHAYMGVVIEPYWLFFPSMGAILFLSTVLVELKAKLRKGIFYMLLAVIIALFVVRTQEKNFLASNEAIYAYHWLKYSPGNLQARLIISSYYEDEVIFIPPKLISEMSETADIFINTHTFDRAKKLLSRLMLSLPEHHPLQGQFSTKLALVYFQEGKITQAENQLVACLKKYPQEKEAYILLGVVLANKNRLQEAVSVWKKGQALNPTEVRFKLHIQKAEALLR